MDNKYNKKSSSRIRLTRRGLLGLGVGAVAGLAAPHIWIPQARASSGARGAIKHLVYVRLSGGFRFPTAFNGDVADEFNPFGVAQGVPDGVQWGVSDLLTRAGYLTEVANQADGTTLAGMGMQSVSALADQITVMPTVDHEPLAGRADGNHTTGLERYLTGYVNGEAGIFTRIMRGLSTRYDQALKDGVLLLPPFVMGSAAMARGFGDYAEFRPPVLSGAGFERFAAREAEPPEWARRMIVETDTRMRDRQHPALRGQIDAFIQTRAATAAYSEVFASETLRIDNDSDELVDGISNRTLARLFGNSSESGDARLALRLFHHGCPAVYLDQGGYDYHSDEEMNLPGAMERANRLISALFVALQLMDHPEGGKYWDHTVVVFGSEFSRTAGGSRFNSARGSDHSGDNATRWMSMPFFGGPVPGGRIVGASTARDDLAAEGTVYSYRAMVNTLMDGLGCDPEVFFPGDDFVPGLLEAKS